MRLEPLAIPDVKLIHLTAHADSRGLLAEVFSQDQFKAMGIVEEWPLDVVSRQAKRGTVRGLHFQTHPAAQAKLVRASKGRLFDAVVDIRTGSPTFGRHVSATLTEDSWTMLYVPVGFAHGFCALDDGAEISYKFSAPYSGAHAAVGLRWNDPDVGIEWPVSPEDVIIAERDAAFPLLKDLPPLFGRNGEAI